MRQILADLVAMHTISDDVAANEQALDYIQSYVEARGMTGKRYTFNGHGAYVASTRLDNLKHPRVLLVAHVDVMHAGEAMFRLRQKGDKLIGRGVYDMKSAIAAYLQAVDGLQDNLADYDFGIMITTDEEYGGRGGINGTRGLVNEGYRADVCILPDGGRNWQVEGLAKGYWRFELIAKGKTAHGSRPWQGESAAYKLVDALHDLKELFRSQGPETNTLNIGMISGGAALNQIPDHMSALVEIRIISKESLAEAKQQLATICAKHNVSTHTIVEREPMAADIDHPLVQEFMKSVVAASGKPSEPCISYAASDAIYFREVGIPYVVTYPIGGLHHSENEWIDESVLTDFPNIIRTYLDRVAKQPLAQTPLEAEAVH